MDGKTILHSPDDLHRKLAKVFPPTRGASWTPTMTGFFYKMGIPNKYEVRCGDYFPYLARIRAARRAPLSPKQL